MKTIIRIAAAVLLGASGPVMAQQIVKNPLDVGFEKLDKDKDGYLDAGELAKAFRGPSAKPVEHKAGDNPKADTQHPDHAFRDTWDADKDGKISRAEFDKYESRVLADLRTAANKKVNYTKAGRSNYRTPQSHRGYSNRSWSYGSNPYTAQKRYMQQSLAQQRQFYAAQKRYMSYSSNSRGAYRGAMAHRGGTRRR
jgi:hypothetical protein